MHVFQFRNITIIITDAVVVVVVVVMMMLERFAALTVFGWRNHNVSSPRCGLLHSQGRLHRATSCTLGAALRPSQSREHYPRRATTHTHTHTQTHTHRHTLTHTHTALFAEHVSAIRMGGPRGPVPPKTTTRPIPAHSRGGKIHFHDRWRGSVRSTAPTPKTRQEAMACSAAVPHRFLCSLPLCRVAPSPCASWDVRVAERWHCDSAVSALPDDFVEALHVAAIPMVLEQFPV